jgi:primosomal protein N' (replication factor Y)
MIARVLLDESLDRELDYGIPAALSGMVVLGTRVRVPVRNRLSLGTVVEIVEESAFERIKDIAEVIGERPVLNATLLRLARWISEYYCTPMPIVMKTLLPNVIRRGEISFRQEWVVELARDPDSAPDEFAALQKRSPKQAQVLEYIAAAKGGEALAVPRVLEACGTTAAPLNALVEKGWVRKFQRTVNRDPHQKDQFLATSELQLSGEQEEALAAVLEMIARPDDRTPLLLYGVTGSGKTEIYLQAMRKVIEAGKTALMLVPEISLTPQTVERFKGRFADHPPEIVAVLHSHLSDGERHDEWHKVASGQARIVIGARSAVFAPLENVGLIVVDEEHENSYKQEEAPRYHGRDIAVLRANFEGCAILLGSATPSLESMANAESGKYRLLRLTQRADDKKMPLVKILDMRLEAKKAGSRDTRSPLSQRLVTALTARLEAKEQSLLFLNRRGYASSVICQVCGHVIECPNCSIALTYHRRDEFLSCHLCGHTGLPPKKCPECADPSIRFAGIGTERVEQAVAKAFPKANVARLDADALVRRETLRQTLHAFRTGKIDILVGTQMIAKGLHFPNVTLVGIISADLGLHVPDFRAAERTFQLLTQVAGRAGRGEVLGEVLVQTFTPAHYAIQFARHHDFDGFYEMEIGWRKQYEYPPQAHMVLINVRSKKQELARFTAENFAQRLGADLPPGVTLSPATPAPLARVAEYYRFHIALRSKRIRPLAAHINRVVAQYTLPSDVLMSIDVDAYDLM